MYYYITAFFSFLFSLNSAPRQERSLFFILTWITITFLVFHTPRAILNVYEFQSVKDKEICRVEASKFASEMFTLYRNSSQSNRQNILTRLTMRQPAGFYWFENLAADAITEESLRVRFNGPMWKLCTRYVENVCLVLNASLNFVYYCLSGRELRGRLCRALLCFLCCFCLAWIKGRGPGVGADMLEVEKEEEQVNSAGEVSMFTRRLLELEARVSKAKQSSPKLRHQMTLPSNNGDVPTTNSIQSSDLVTPVLPPVMIQMKAKVSQVKSPSKQLVVTTNPSGRTPRNIIICDSI